MKKILPAAIVLIIIVLVLGYLGRHQIKSLLGMNPTPSATSQTNIGTNPAAGAPSNNIYLTKTDASKGNYMTDFAGMTLYTYSQDTNGVSNCTGSCLTTWPVYTSGATAQGSFPDGITVITRSDGTKQFAWHGMPLYYFASDKNPGDITGDSVDGFNIVKL